MSKRVFKTELDAVNNSLQAQVNNSISKTIVDAKGDIVTASAADTPIRLAVGTNEHRLVADSATTSGLKYVADTTNYAVAAKGDLLVGTAADTVTALSVGTNNYVLTADSAEATGLKWAAPSSPSYVGVSAYKSGNQSISNATATAVTFDLEDFDTDAFHDTSTNTSRFTVPAGKGGKYLISGFIDFATNATGFRAAGIYKNGSVLNYGPQVRPTDGEATFMTMSFVLNLVATDYIEIFVYQTSGGSLNINGGNNYTSLQVNYLGA